MNSIRIRIVIFFVLFIALIVVVIFGVYYALNSHKGDTPALSAEAVRDIDTLKAEYPQYFDLGDFKGLELYVWQTGEKVYRCGLMPGTNRNKTEEEISELGLVNHSVSIDEMKLILSTYDIPDEDVFVIACSMPHSSYYYVIDDEYINKISDLFDNRYYVGTMEAIQ